MTLLDVLVLHSALGLRPAVRAFSARIAAVGHRVFTPDLYDGQVFAEAEAGVAYMRWLGWDRLVARAESAAADIAGCAVGSSWRAHNTYREVSCGGSALSNPANSRTTLTKSCRDGHKRPGRWWVLRRSAPSVRASAGTT